MLYPDENMVHWTSAAGSATYPGQEYKIRHLKYSFDNFLLVSKNVLANRVGMFADSEESLAGVVVDATRAFADAWFPVPPYTVGRPLCEAQQRAAFHARCLLKGRESWHGLLLEDRIAATPTKSSAQRSQYPFQASHRS